MLATEAGKRGKDMGKDKETKKLDAEELEKRVAPFAEPLHQRDTELPNETGSGSTTGSGGADKPMKK